MKRYLLLLSSFFLFQKGFAFWVGNPSDPTLYGDGLITCGEKSYSIRFGYLSDYTYHFDFKDEIIKETSQPSEISLSTHAGMLVLNLGNRIDLYGILGASKLEEENVYIPRRFSWAIGGKATFYRYRKFSVGGDLKYFFSDQKPGHFIIENMPATLLTDFTLGYSELQGAVAASYKCGVFIPYAGLTYVDAKIKPSFRYGFIDIADMTMEFEADSVINEKKWGMVIGLTLLSAKIMTLNVETRFFDQNAVNVSGEIRF